MDGRASGRTEGRTDGRRASGRTDGWTEGTDIFTDRQSYESPLSTNNNCRLVPAGRLQAVVEYAPHGNLKDFLRVRRHDGLNDDEEDDVDPSGYQRPRPPSSSIHQHHLTSRDLVSFAFQAARGLEFLASIEVSYTNINLPPSCFIF